MLVYVLTVIALGLTVAMFVSNSPGRAMLGFPAAIFWALLGAYYYTTSARSWTDIGYYMVFACTLGMTFFSIYSSFALHEKRNPVGEGDEEPEEGTQANEEEEEEEELNPRVKAIRQRAQERREGRRRPYPWGRLG